MSNENELFVKDIYAAAFLFASGKRLIRLERQDKFFWFIFEDKKSCESLLNDYWNGEAKVKARLYADAFKVLKDRLFAQRY